MHANTLGCYPERLIGDHMQPMPLAPDLSGCALDGRYELHAVIGEGAFGRVYRGLDRRLDRPIAIKMIKPWWAEDPEWGRNFEREAQLLARVSDPGIVQIFDVGHAAEGLYYVSELVDGESLASRLQRGALDPWEACGVAEQLCRALARAHAQSIVHRDVKPANILIAADGQIKVGDFGVARLAQASSDGGAGTIVGTPRYMAPEQARGRRTTPATDVYSAGIVLYEMLAGRPPFTERSAVELALRHLRDRPAPLPTKTPRPLRQIVDRALAKDPAKRYLSGREMAEALALASRSAPARERDALARERARPRQRRPAVAPPRSRHWSAVPAPTRPAPKLSPRRNSNPAARRRSAAALGLAFALLGAMLAAAFAIGSTGYVRVPALSGLSRQAVRTRARNLSLQPSFSSRYAGATRGTVIAQSPRPGRRVSQGSAVRIVLSAGPPPVKVPALAGTTVSDARAALTKLGLNARAIQVVAPLDPAGTVTSQSPAPGAELPRSSSVTVNVAETPSWRPIASLSGSAAATSVRFRVRGPQWRVVYTMAYQGTCTFIVFCSGPHDSSPGLRAAPTWPGSGSATAAGRRAWSGPVRVSTGWRYRRAPIPRAGRCGSRITTERLLRRRGAPDRRPAGGDRASEGAAALELLDSAVALGRRARLGDADAADELAALVAGLDLGADRGARARADPLVSARQPGRGQRARPPAARPGRARGARAARGSMREAIAELAGARGQRASELAAHARARGAAPRDDRAPDRGPPAHDDRQAGARVRRAARARRASPTADAERARAAAAGHGAGAVGLGRAAGDLADRRWTRCAAG